VDGYYEELINGENVKQKTLTIFISTRSSSNQEVVSLSFRTLAMYMQANAIM
jgi:hypothetical protein